MALGEHGRLLSNANKAGKGAKAVILFNKEGKELMRFVSATDCAQHLGTTTDSVSMCARGKSKSFLNGDFTAKYAKDYKKARPEPRAAMEIKRRNL